MSDKVKEIELKIAQIRVHIEILEEMVGSLYDKTSPEARSELNLAVKTLIHIQATQNELSEVSEYFNRYRREIAPQAVVSTSGSAKGKMFK